MRYFKVLSCKIFQRELAQVLLSCPNALDITFMRQDLHMRPALLREALQKEIDLIESGNDLHTNETRIDNPEAILLGYGLCSNALAGITSRRLPLVIPRAHDCITCLMGSKEAYADYFETIKGSFFYSRGWLELGLEIGQSDLERKRNEYTERFEGDEDTVEYLLEMDKEMLKHYQYITYITWPGISGNDDLETAHRLASNAGMKLLRYEGSNRLMADLVNGNWNEEDFLILQPGQTLQPSFDSGIIKGI